MLGHSPTYRHGSPRDASVPMFFLFGEPQRAASPGFLHIEPLEERSRRSAWNIRPHAHADLHHLFLITEGAGRMKADFTCIEFAAPCLLLVPARIVHEFNWKPETCGEVLTLADDAWRELLAREPAFSSLFEMAACLEGIDARAFEAQFAALGREIAWSAPGHATAVMARLQIVFVDALRLSKRARGHRTVAPGRAVSLVARFREAVEQGYRSDLSVEAYAQSLRVTPSSLRRACLRVAGLSPVRIIHDRVFLEAQRLLLFTNMSVSEAAGTLGFDDSAYFTRFFAKRAGRSPRAFRACVDGED